MDAPDGEDKGYLWLIKPLLKAAREERADSKLEEGA